MKLPDTPAPPASTEQFTVRLSSTRRGARLARRLTAERLAAWGIPYDSEASHAAVAVTAELAVNAITHGRLPGRDFRLSLARLPGGVRIEVTDTRPERLPKAAATSPTGPDALEAETGRGLLLIAAYADTWGCQTRDAHTKTVWAEITYPS
ncbi:MULTISPECIES: ATP-binding protein [Streptomyces]|uniref:Anti-sigma regulatory factor (Ser/Thr protein kinase) n=1 Tax=Streptomyces clavifer TaxID=68188 RepID=A0ABS4VJW9_9ACTN|nr:MULTISPECIES: ATP-binding protein [Streptomyces]MBP2364220.1 anti-sigma regulatory factor (Ser/Thr protein kinase) [Streptomyces clavifer]MDX2744359.1 ATP-binding protein [Streptomyces sp. NRRL_B-2557]GHB11321.1 ATP-binding protein [Streptomyces clavifer]